MREAVRKSETGWMQWHGIPLGMNRNQIARRGLGKALHPPHYNRRCENGGPTPSTGVPGRLNLLQAKDCRGIGIVYYRTGDIGKTLLSLASMGPK